MSPPENDEGRFRGPVDGQEDAPESSPGRSEGRKFARGPRRAAQASKLERFEAIATLDKDPAFVALREEDRRILRVGVVEFGDARLTFFPSLANWASTAGVSRATVGRAVKRARDAGVLAVTPHLRPPTASRLGQTSSTYHLLVGPNKVSHDLDRNKVSHDADLNKVSHGETPGKASQHGETPEPDLTPSGVKSGEDLLDEDRDPNGGSSMALRPDRRRQAAPITRPDTLDEILDLYGIRIEDPKIRARAEATMKHIDGPAAIDAAAYGAADNPADFGSLLDRRLAEWRIAV